MRLTTDEINNIKQSVLELDSGAEIYLFGSRADNARRGGDIDLIIKSKKLNKYDLRKIRGQFFAVFGEQKMDLIIDSGDPNNVFINMVKPKAIKL